MKISLALVLLTGFFFAAGCVSVPSSRSPVFFGIAAMEDENILPIELSSDFAVAVSEVKIPDFLNRPQIVTQDKDHQLRFAQFHRWAEPLNEGLTRVVKDNISRILPRAKIVGYPLDFPTEMIFRLDMQVTRFEIDLSGDLHLVVQWAVVDVGYPKNTVLRRSEFRLPVENGNYSGAVKALSAVCASLSGQISQVIYEMSVIVKPGSVFK